MSRTTIQEPVEKMSGAGTSTRTVVAVGGGHVRTRGVKVPPPWARHERLLQAAFLVGLAGVFFVNALVALLQPADFTQLVEKSAMSRWLHLDPGSWLGPVVGLNDLAIGLAVLAAIRFRRTRTVVLAWAGMWLFAVMLIKVTALQAFPV